MFFSRLSLSALLLAASLPSSAAAPEQAVCNYARVARLPLAYSGPNLQITTPGSINGKPATMLVDTGAYDISLTSSGARRHGLQLRDTGKESYGIGGYARSYQARVDRFALGPVTVGKSYMTVVDNASPSIDALAGVSFLLQTDLEISLATKELNFFKPDNCDGKFLGYWDPAAVVLPFLPGSGGIATPHFRVRVNGVELDAIIDSGADISLLSLPAARRAGVKLDETRRLGDVGGIGSQRRAQWSAILDKIEIGAELIERPEISIVEHDMVDVILGADFLRSHRVLFAMSQNRIYLSYVGGAPFGERRKLAPWIVAEAEGGNHDAQYALAKAYLSGTRIPRNTAQGKFWLERAASNGNPAAQKHLGSITAGDELTQAAPAKDDAAAGDE